MIQNGSQKIFIIPFSGLLIESQLLDHLRTLMLGHLVFVLPYITIVLTQR